MAKVGRLLLLAVCVLLLSGASSQLNAQEKRLTLTATHTNRVCSELDFFLITNRPCLAKKIPQAERVAKVLANHNDKDEENLTSYELESTYYKEPTPTPTAHVENDTPTPSQPTNVFVPASGPNVNSDIIFELINAHRVSIGKPAFQKDPALCTLAQTRSFELYGELFEGKGYLHSGLYNRNLPYWITEDAKWGSDEAGTVNWWLNSPVHRSAIEGDYTYSCGACNGSQCAQLFTSYTPKIQVQVTPTIAPPLASKSE